MQIWLTPLILILHFIYAYLLRLWRQKVPRRLIRTSTNVLKIRNCRMPVGAVCFHFSVTPGAKWLQGRHLAVWQQIEIPTPSIDDYLLKEQSCQISSRSVYKRRSLWLFWRGHPNKNNKMSDDRSVPDLKNNTCVLSDCKAEKIDQSIYIPASGSAYINMSGCLEVEQPRTRRDHPDQSFRDYTHPLDIRMTEKSCMQIDIALTKTF